MRVQTPRHVSTKTDLVSPKVRRKECNCGRVNEEQMEAQAARCSWEGVDGAALGGLWVKKDFDQCRCWWKN